MKKSLLVTLADENYIDQAKQLFSSIYFNAGWKGDYMLLAHEIPEDELKWFRDKGILIKECKPFYNKKAYSLPVTVLSKCYLFTPEFKKWKNIIYLDGDIIVRASLNELAKINGLAARHGGKLSKQFIKPNPGFFYNQPTRIFDELKKNYNLSEHGFNAGVMAFNTDVIKEGTFFELKKLFDLYGKISTLGEQTILNLLFYKKFIPLPYVYNCWVKHMMRFRNIKPEKIKGIILHFMSGEKAWSQKNPFYNEWKNNLNKADLIDLNKIPPPRESWTREDIEKYCQYLHKRFILYFYRYIIWKISIFIDRLLGLIGIFLKNNFPKLYFILKN